MARRNCAAVERIILQARIWGWDMSWSFSRATPTDTRSIGHHYSEHSGHVEKIIGTYTQRPTEVPRYARRVSMQEIEKNGFNLNVSRYVNTAVADEEIDLSVVRAELVALDQKIKIATHKHNEFLKELGLPPLP